MSIGIGGAPTRPVTMPTDARGRKETPIASGVLDYFPDAIVAIAQVSFAGNEQHNPGKPLHWDRSKSSDEADTMLRHFMERGKIDTDGRRHTAKAAWRLLALLQKEIEAECAKVPFEKQPASNITRVIPAEALPVVDPRPGHEVSGYLPATKMGPR